MCVSEGRVAHIVEGMHRRVWLPQEGVLHLHGGDAAPMWVVAHPVEAWVVGDSIVGWDPAVTLPREHDTEGASAVDLTQAVLQRTKASVTGVFVCQAPA